MNGLQEEDFYLDTEGLMVFTEKYHLKRGYCCESGCKHCPYDFKVKTMAFCPYCFSSATPVFVHGHSQCADCKINIDPCCSGGPGQ